MVLTHTQTLTHCDKQTANESLEDPVILIIADIAFDVLALPTLIMRGLLPRLIEVDDLLF